MATTDYFTTTIVWGEEHEGSVEAPLKTPIRVSWDQTGDPLELWKQQELVLAALNLAISQTFLALCNIKDIDIDSFSSKVTGKFESGDHFKKIREARYNLDVRLKNENYAGLLTKIVHETKTRCGLLNVLTLDVEFNLNVLS